MNFRQMQYFSAVYEEGSFSKAALRENCTQSGLSQQVRRLEERLGMPLFARTPFGVEATAAGTEYYKRCVAILQSVHAAEQHMTGLRGQLSGTVRAGLIPSLTKGVLAGVLNDFTAAHPYVELRILEAYSRPLTDQVIADELDFAIVPVLPETSVPGLRCRILSREHEMLLSGPALGLQNLAPLPLAEIAGLKLVLPSPVNSRRPYLDNQLASAGIVPRQVMNIDGMVGTLEFVAESDWATILPVTNCIDEVARGRFVINPIVAPAIDFEFVLIEANRRPLSAAARLFVAAIEAKLDEVSVRWARWTGQSPEAAALRS